MRFFAKSRYLLCLLTLALVVSCGDDNKGDDGGEIGGVLPPSPLKPDQHKARLETVGKDFVAQFNAADHEMAADAIKYLNDIIDAPGLFDDDEDYLAKTLIDIRAVIMKNDLTGLAGLATRSSVDIYTLADYAGVYSYDLQAREWKKKDATGKISLEYTNGNKPCVLTMTFEGEKDYTQAEGVVVKVPAKINFSMKIGGAEQVGASVETKLSADQKSADVTVKLSLIGGYKWELVVNAKSSVVTETYKMSKNDQILMASTAKLTGNKLTSPDDIDNGEAGDMLADCEMDFRIMDVAIIAKGDIKAIIDGLDKIEEKQTDEQKTEQEAAICNQYAKIILYYADKTGAIADVKLKAFYDGENWGYHYNPQSGKMEYGKYKDYELMPELVFVSDGSRYDMDTYFSKANFGSLIQSIETLVNKYADLIDADHVEL